jgi:hypothetical protein
VASNRGVAVCGERHRTQLPLVKAATMGRKKIKLERYVQPLYKMACKGDSAHDVTTVGSDDEGSKCQRQLHRRKRAPHRLAKKIESMTWLLSKEMMNILMML